MYLYLIVPFWYASAANQASLVEPWFVFWRDVVEPKYPCRDQTSEPERPPKRTKKVRLGIYPTQIQKLAKHFGTSTLLFQSECFITRRQTSHNWRARSSLVLAGKFLLLLRPVDTS